MQQPISEQLRGLIYKKTGLRQPNHSSDRADNVVRSRMKTLRLATATEYENLLETGDSKSQAELRELIVGLTNGETHFFRDKGQFALLENTLLPSLIQANKSSKTLRIWSAACATGEEAHSIAIVLDSLLPAPTNWRIEILGTDINQEALRTARAGVYSRWSFRGVNGERKAAYFERNSDDWEVKSKVRANVRFRYLDLINDDFPSVESGIHDIDLVLCKNVFIYFEPKTIRRVLERITKALRPGGFLLTAHGELHAQDPGQLQLLSFPESAAYQKKQVASPESPRAIEPRHTPEVSRVTRSIRSVPEESNTGTELSDFEKRARNCANEGKYEAAEEWCQRALRQNPFAPGIYYLLAKVAEERKQKVRAKEMLNRVLYLDPGFVSAYIDLAALFNEENDSMRARKLHLAALDCLRRLRPEDRVETCAATVAELTSALEGLIDCEALA
jgi:chemotaxis protein methyltransferase CheR